MGLKRDKFRGIVGGITSQPQEDAPADSSPPVVEQGSRAVGTAPAVEATIGMEHHRFAKRGRPKGRKDEEAGGKVRKVKVSLFLSETLVKDLYDWAYADKIHPGEMFERALKPFHEKEAKRRNS